MSEKSHNVAHRKLGSKIVEVVWFNPNFISSNKIALGFRVVRED